MCADLQLTDIDETEAPPAGQLRVRDFDWRRDRQTVLGFQYETYEGNFPGFRVTDEFLDDFSDQLRRAVRNRWERPLVLVDQTERVWGFIWLAMMSTMVDDWVGYIKNVHIAPGLRGKGYARVLLDEADRWFRANNAAKSTLDASLCNPHAVAVYEAAGYRIARVRMEKRYSD